MSPSSTSRPRIGGGRFSSDESNYNFDDLLKEDRLQLSTARARQSGDYTQVPIARAIYARSSLADVWHVTQGWHVHELSPVPPQDNPDSGDLTSS
jgi:hypothetical protein